MRGKKIIKSTETRKAYRERKSNHPWNKMTFEIEDIYYDDCIHVIDDEMKQNDDDESIEYDDEDVEEETRIEQHPLIIWKDTIIGKNRRNSKGVKKLLRHFRYDIKKQRNGKNGRLIIEWIPSYVSPRDIKTFF